MKRSDSTRNPSESANQGPWRFHSGQLSVQRRAEVEASARQVARSILARIPPVGADFLSAQRMAVVGWKDVQDRVWASILLAKPGFLRSVGGSVLHIDTSALAPGDPIGELSSGSSIGLLAIDLDTRRRMVVGGTISTSQTGWDLIVDRVYSQCPKYIQAKGPAEPDVSPSTTPLARVGARLEENQRQWIGRADVFFLASHHPVQGGGVSHRGGRPGFVHVIDDATLEFPDYPGNRMFLTLGNIASHPRAGLLFVDFHRRRLLQLTGRGELRWDDATLRSHPGAQLAVRFGVEEVRETSY